MMRSVAVLIAVASLSISLPKSTLCALAEEDMQVTEEVGDATGAGDAEGEEVDGTNLEDSAQELSDKLAQLKALLDAKGEGADPELKARLDSLQGQLGALGLGDIIGGGGAMAPSQELTEFLTGCVAMSLRRAGAQRPATIGALRRLAEDKLSPDEAAKLDLWRMVGACINDLTQQELEQFKEGKLVMLPKAYVEMSKKPEVEESVKGLEETMWNELKTISRALLKDLIGNTEEQKPPVMFGALFAFPLLGALAFLAKKFIDMQGETGNKKEKKKSKKSQ